MAKKSEKSTAELAVDELTKALTAKNDMYAPGIEVARLDAAELILKTAQIGLTNNGPADTALGKARELAVQFLVDAMSGKVSTLGASQRTRAAGIIIRHEQGSL